MSDPAKTPEEIEDVLASIRRLVSDNSQSSGVAVDSALHPVQEDETPAAVIDDRLVLSPSFRITDPEDPWVPVATAQTDELEDEPADEPAEDLASDTSRSTTSLTAPKGARNDAGWQPEDRLARFDAVGADEDALGEPQDPSDEDISNLAQLDGASGAPAEFESETGDDDWPATGAEAALLTLVARRDPIVGNDDAQSGPSQEAVEDTPQDESAVFVADSDLSDEEVSQLADKAEDADHDVKDQATEALVLKDDELQEDDVQQDGAQDDAQEDDAQEDGAQKDAAEDELAEKDLADDDQAIDDFDENEDTEEAAEVVTGSSEPDETPDFVHDDAETQTPPPIFSGRNAPEDSVEDLGEEASPFSFPEADDSILDEDTLREIIVDVVREELQGVLGQRITRNVRKMVRREIRLALAAEELE